MAADDEGHLELDVQRKKKSRAKNPRNTLLNLVKNQMDLTADVAVVPQILKE